MLGNQPMAAGTTPVTGTVVDVSVAFSGTADVSVDGDAEANAELIIAGTGTFTSLMELLWEKHTAASTSWTKESAASSPTWTEEDIWK